MKGLPDLQDVGRLVSRAVGQKAVVGATPAQVVHHENKWRLLRYEPRPAGRGGPSPSLRSGEGPREPGPAPLSLALHHEDDLSM